MTQLEQMKQIFSDFSEAPMAKLIKYEHIAPDFVAEAYNKLCGSIENIYEAFKKAALLLGMNQSVFSTFEKENPNLRECVVIAGGAISDFVIHKENAEPYAPKDIDIFIQELIPDFFDNAIQIGASNSKHFGYDLCYEMRYSGLEDLKDYVYSDKIKGLTFGYAIFSYALNQALDNGTCYWEPNHHYTNEHFHYVHTGKFNDIDTEVIICDNNKIFNFDLIFKSCYYTNNQIYLLDIALEDIRNKVIHVANANSPVTTLLRVLYFEDKLNFTIEPYSFNALLEFIDGKRKRVDDIIDSMQNQPKLTASVSSKIMKLFNIPLSTPLNVKSFDGVFTLKECSNSSFGLYHSIDKFQTSQMFFKKTLCLLKSINNFKTINCVFKRPDNWHNDMFVNELKGVTFNDWINSSFLYDSVAPISMHKDLLINLVTSNNPSQDFSNLKKHNKQVFNQLSLLVSGLVKSTEFHFPIYAGDIIQLLFKRQTYCSDLVLEVDANGFIRFINRYEGFSLPEEWLSSLDNFFSQLPQYLPQQLDGIYYRDLLH